MGNVSAPTKVHRTQGNTRITGQDRLGLARDTDEGISKFRRKNFFYRRKSEIFHLD